MTPNAAPLALLLLSLLAGCHSSHHHALLVTSEPSAQRCVVQAYDEDGAKVTALNGRRGVTPHELVFPEKAALVNVNLEFGTGKAHEKQVSFHHARSTNQVWREPVFGIPLSTVQRETLGPQRVHFDQPGFRTPSEGQ